MNTKCPGCGMKVYPIEPLFAEFKQLPVGWEHTTGHDVGCELENILLFNVATRDLCLYREGIIEVLE